MMTRGEAIIDLMNAVKYDVAIPGNHEFDYGMQRFLELANKADFPYISCNLTGNGERILEPYIIKEAAGIRIAFVGITTPHTLTSSNPANFADENGKRLYGFTEDSSGEKLYKAVQDAVDSAEQKALDPEATYTVAGQDYHLADHGDGYTMFDGAKSVIMTGKLDSEVLTGYIKDTLGGEVGEDYADPYGQGRIKIIQQQ